MILTNTITTITKTFFMIMQGGEGGKQFRNRKISAFAVVLQIASAYPPVASVGRRGSPDSLEANRSSLMVRLAPSLLLSPRSLMYLQLRNKRLRVSRPHQL